MRKAQFEIGNFIIAMIIFSMIALFGMSFYLSSLTNEGLTIGAGMSVEEANALNNNITSLFTNSETLSDDVLTQTSNTTSIVQTNDANVFWRGVKGIGVAFDYVNNLPLLFNIAKNGYWKALPSQFWDGVMALIIVLSVLLIAGAYWRYKVA